MPRAPPESSMKPFHPSTLRSACRSTAAVLISTLAACAMPATEEAPIPSEQYRALLANPIRTERDRGMDERRHPVELLQFAQVRPGMHVLDIASGGGYTSQLLALAVGPSGKLWAQVQQPGNVMKERLAANPQTGIVVVARPFDDPVPPEAAPLDLVTLILNYHDISYLAVDRDAMNRRIFAALKPGGRYVIVDHSALPGTGISAGKTLHRIEQAFVVAEVRRAGFVEDGEGAFMRNPADTRDKPSSEPGSDKFALRFVKPR
jgi:predicted methyltransferase